MDCTPDPAVSGQSIALLDRPVRLRLAIPAVLFLESRWPLSYIGSQMMVFFAPVVHALFSAREYDLIQEALEHREAIGYFLDLIEEKDAEIRKAERADRRARRKRNSGTLP